MLGLPSLLAAVLAGVGLYAVTAYGVADRTREFGIRMALGARAGGIVWLVLRQNALTVAIGTALGLLTAVSMARMLASRVENITPLDAATCLVAVLALGVIAVAASVAPARSAVGVDPLNAMRHE